MRQRPELVKMVQLAAGIFAEDHVSNSLEKWLPKSLSDPLDPLASYAIATVLIIVATDRFLALPTVNFVWREVLTQEALQGPDLILTHDGRNGDDKELHVSIQGGSWLARRVRNVLMRSGATIVFWLDPDFTRIVREGGTGGSTDGRKLYMDVMPSRGGGEAKLGWAALRINPHQASAIESLTCHYTIEVSGKFSWLAQLRFTSSVVKNVRLTRR